jgi:hypothetical protein
MKTSQKKLSGWRALLFPAILAILTGGQDVFSQGVGISEAPITPDASSILELRSTVRGLLTPRMTTLERLAIAAPAQGLLVYDTTTRSYWYFDSGWKAFASGAWGLSNQLLGMNAAGDANEYKTLSGTLNQVNVTHNPGLITLSTPQDIAPSSSPVFNSLTLTNPLTIPNGGTNSATPLDGSSIMISNGNSIVQGEKGTLNTVLHGNPAGAPFYSQVMNADIAADAVTTDKIMDETIISGDIRDGTIANIDLDKINIPLSGFGAAVLNVDLGSQRIINLQNPVDNQDAATKIYVDNAVDSDNNLLEGNIWVGDNTNNQAMVDASQSGFMLVGDGTTVNSVDITGDVDVDATGLTTIQPNAVTTLEILDETILATDIATGAVTTEEILDDTILEEDIAPGAVTTEEILNETILAEDIADDAVTTSEILDHTIADIDLDKLNIPLSGFGAAVLNVDLGSQRITNLQNPVDNQDAATKIYVDNAVDSDNNLLEGNIWVGDNTNNQAMVDASQSGFMLVGDGTTVNSVDITGDVDVDATGLTTIQPNAVTTLEILDETILATDIAPGAVTTEEILDETILAEDIATGAVTTEKILDDTILEEDIAPGAVTTEEIRNETILAEDIADDAVTTSEILDHTIADIDLDKLNIPLSGFGAAVLNVDLGSQRIINLQNPVDNQDAATKIYVDNSFGVADNLDEGHIWVGDNTNNQAMVDASQSGFMLVGDGTTVNSVDITGDVEVDAAGLTTIQPDAVTTLEILNGTILNADIADGTINLREKVTNVLPVENGGTNSGTPLVGGRVMVSRDGRIVEAGVMNPGQVVVGTASDPAIVTVTGDISIDQSGATVIGNGAVNSAKISDGTVMNSDIAGSAAIDATKIAAGTVDNDELGYLDGVSSGIQGQFTGVQTGIADEITRATAAEVLLTTNLNNEVTRATNAETTLAGDITAEEARAMAAETVLTNSISAEVTRATNAEATLTTNLAAEVTRATNAETSLGNDIAAEETRALAAETVLTNSISAEVTRATNAETVLANDISAEEARAMAAETALANDITAEETRALAAETILASDIAAEEARAIAAETALAGDILAEETRAIAAETILASDLAAEETRAIAAETALSSDITAEETRAMAAEAILATDITAEEARAIAAETALANDITAEETRALAAETTLASDIAAEETRAIAAETALSSDITAEETRAMAAEAILATDITAEEARAIAAETALANDITAEETRALAAETTLAGDIAAEEARAIAAETALANDITAEETRALAAETTLAGDIAAEEARAIAAETALANDITAEETRAMAAEAILATDITAEESRAIAAETALASDIATEETRAIAAETILSSDITAEETRAIAAEAILASDIAAEEARAIAAETALSSDIVAEESRAIAAETSLASAISTETTNRTAADLLKVDANTAITAGTNTKISYDSKGLVTGGSQAILASADFNNQGAANTVLHGNASGAPTWGLVSNADIATGIDATKLADGTIDNTEFLRLDGVSANIQTQINSIMTYGTTLLAGLTPNTPVRTNASNNLVSGTINLASADVAGTLPVANGGTGASTAQAAMNTFAGSVSAGRYLRGDGTNVTMSQIQSGDIPLLNQNTTGNAGTATALQTPRNIYGNGFNGTADLNQVISSAYGGTGNGFTLFTGPTGTEKTFTLPNASATILTTNSPVTVPQGGTGITSGTQGGIPYFNSGTTMVSSGLLAQNGIMIGGGSGAAPSTIAMANNGVVVTNSSGVPSVQPKIQESNLPAGTVLLIYFDENDVAGTISNANAKSTTLPANNYSRVIIEAEVSLSTPAAADGDWSFNLYVNGIAEETIRLELTNKGAISGSIKTSVVQSSSVPVTISVIPTDQQGTWTVKSLRIYGVI